MDVPLFGSQITPKPVPHGLSLRAEKVVHQQFDLGLSFSDPLAEAVRFYKNAPRFLHPTCQRGAENIESVFRVPSQLRHLQYEM